MGWNRRSVTLRPWPCRLMSASVSVSVKPSSGIPHTLTVVSSEQLATSCKRASSASGQDRSTDQSIDRLIGVPTRSPSLLHQITSDHIRSSSAPRPIWLHRIRIPQYTAVQPRFADKFRRFLPRARQERMGEEEEGEKGRHNERRTESRGRLDSRNPPTSPG